MFFDFAVLSFFCAGLQVDMLMGNYIQVKYTLENGQGQFEMPEIDGLRIISGPNTSSSMSVINGEVKQSSSYAIYLEPIDIGVGYIGPIYITNDEGTLESQPINLVILDNPDGTLIDPNKLKFVEEVVLTADGKLKRKKKKIKRYKI